MATNESSPLLPRARQSVSKTASWEKEASVSPTLRRRSMRRNGSPERTASKQQHDDGSDGSDGSDDSDKDSDDDDGDGTEGFADDAATRAAYGGAAVRSHHLNMRRAQRAVAEPTPLNYASDSSLSTTLGLTKRKPRWAGFRSKVSTLATTMEKASNDSVVPRKKTRRHRYRTASDFDSPQRRHMKNQQRQNATHEPPTDQAMARVAAYCTSDQIGVFKLLKWLDRVVKDDPSSGQLSLRGWKNKMYMGVVHSSYQAPKQKQTNDEAEEEEEEVAVLLQRKDAFYFATGCCVFWGLTREEEAVHIQALAAFSTARVAEIEAEDMEFTYGDASRIANDAIFLRSVSVEEKLAIAFAMSQSAKLDVFEERVEDRIRKTKHIPFNLATTGSIQYSQTDISKLIGQLFIELADVNLHSDILDEPDFLWEDDEYEPLYKKMLKYLDVNNRVKILNKRLDILRELVEVLNQELTQQHGTKLEWIIIWLLVVEVIISLGWNILVKDLLGYFNRK